MCICVCSCGNFLHNEHRCASQCWCSPTRHTTSKANYSYPVCDVPTNCTWLHLQMSIAASLTMAKEGHSILPIVIWAFPSLLFPIWTFPIWTFSIWVFPKSEHKFEHFQFENLDMICHSPVRRVWNLRSTETVKQFSLSSFIIETHGWGILYMQLQNWLWTWQWRKELQWWAHFVEWDMYSLASPGYFEEWG